MVVETPTKRLVVNLPPLLEWQQKVENYPARFKVLVCGRRIGKTHYGIYKCLKEALENPGQIYWWIGPIFPISDIGWRLLKRICGQLTNAGLPIKVREDPRFVELPNGAQIWVKSADNPDSLRGEGLSGVVFDEAAQIKAETWFDVIRASLSDKRGWAVFITTPKGKNWIYDLCQYSETDPNWHFWQLSTRENPHINPAEILEAKRIMSENSFKQEFEADFGASQYLVYDFNKQIHKWKQDIPEFAVVRGALDFGGTSISSHKSAGTAGIITAKDELILIDEFEQAGPNIAERQMNWMWEVEQKIRDLSFKSKRKIDQVIWHAEKTQIVGIQLMRQMGFIVIPSKGGPDSVIEGIELVARRLKVREDGYPRLYYRDGLHYIPDAFERYRYPEPTSEDKPLAQKPLKVNDDMVDAVRYLIEGLDRNIIGDPAELYKNAFPMLAS